LSAFRGPNPVIALCSNDKVHRLLSLSYGVIPFSEYRDLSSQELYVEAVRLLLQKKYVTLEDKVAYLSGSLGQGGGNTFLEINKVKDVIG
jgi:pyruvate kinase